jgi:hypothetical protein
VRYYAHTAELPDRHRDPNPERWQLLKDHLSRVAALAARFAQPFGLQVGDSPSVIRDPTRFQEA